MQSISDTLSDLNNKIKRRAASLKNHKDRIPKKPIQQKLRPFKGTVNIPNNIFEIMIADPDLDKRELKILMLVIRLTFGLNCATCRLRNRDFETAQVRETHSQKIVASLIGKEWLVKSTNPARDAIYRIHPKRYDNMQRDGKLTHLICTRLHEKGIWQK
jgi:hypothetical protein